MYNKSGNLIEKLKITINNKEIEYIHNRLFKNELI